MHVHTVPMYVHPLSMCNYGQTESMKDRIQPLKEHHIGRFVDESQQDASQVPRRANHYPLEVSEQ